MWEELIVTALGGILTVVIGMASVALRQYTGITIQKRHREALHEALLSGASSAVMHGPQEGLRTLKAQAVAHARESVPDAIRALVPGDTVLDRIAERYVMEALERFTRADTERLTRPTSTQLR